MAGNMPTAMDYRKAARNALLVGGSPLSQSVVELPTSNAGLLVEAASTVGIIVGRQLQDAYAGLLLGSARGADLDLLVRDRYEITRNGAAPGFGEASLTRPTAAAGAITVAAGTKLVAGAVELETMEPVSFGVLGLGPLVVDVKTTRGGSDQGVVGGTALQPQGLTDTSIVAALVDDLAGQDDEESDEELVARARDYWPNARRGTLGAITNGLRSTTGVYRATVVESLDPNGDLAGHVEAWISDKAGRSNTTLAAQADAVLLEYRCAGIQVVVRSTTPAYVQIEVNVAFDAGVDTSAKREEVRVALMTKVNALGPGVSLRLGMLYAAVEAISGVTADEDSFVEPVGDLLADVDECIRTRPDLILVNGG